MPHNLLVNTRCTDSSLLIAVIVHGDQTGEQYSSNGRTYVTKAHEVHQGAVESRSYVRKRLTPPGNGGSRAGGDERS